MFPTSIFLKLPHPWRWTRKLHRISTNTETSSGLDKQKPFFMDFVSAKDISRLRRLMILTFLVQYIFWPCRRPSFRLKHQFSRWNYTHWEKILHNQKINSYTKDYALQGQEWIHALAMSKIPTPLMDRYEAPRHDLPRLLDDPPVRSPSLSVVNQSIDVAQSLQGSKFTLPSTSWCPFSNQKLLLSRLEPCCCQCWYRSTKNSTQTFYSRLKFMIAPS